MERTFEGGAVSAIYSILRGFGSTCPCAALQPVDFDFGFECAKFAIARHQLSKTRQALKFPLLNLEVLRALGFQFFSQGGSALYNAAKFL